MISVVLPTFNSSAYLEPAIESVLAQTFRDFELLVCDDGSTDRTVDVVERMAARDGRVRLLRHGFRSVSRNCNAAIEAARFPWIARLDGDDLMLPERLERQAEAAARDPSVVLWGSHTGLINGKGRLLRVVRSGPEDEAAYRAARDGGRFVLIHGPSVMFRRDLALRLGGYDPRFDSIEDLDLLHRMIPHGTVRVIPEVLTLYRIHGASFTAGKVARQEHLRRYIVHRTQARLRRQEPLGLEDFLDRLANRPRLVRLHDQRRGLARRLYRNGRLDRAEGRYLAMALRVALALALSPRGTSRALMPHAFEKATRARARAIRRGAVALAAPAGEGQG
jgi:glycosyltransferase involved in cell wall biosynthesis